MEQTDRKILQNLIAQRVARVISQIVNKECLDADIHVEVTVGTPSCYVDDMGESHTGKLITVEVDLIEEVDEDED